MVSYIDYWRMMKFDSRPFVHPCDADSLRNVESNNINGFDDFILDERFQNPDDKSLHLGLRPGPFCGDLNKATVFILLLNPGLNEGDYYAENNVPGLDRRMENVIHQKLENEEYPFLWLDPSLCWLSASQWWHKKLSSISYALNSERKEPYTSTLKYMSKSIAAIELFPYHSRSFENKAFLKKLKSTSKAIDFVNSVLLQRARIGEITIIVTRQSKKWGLGKCKLENIICYTGGQSRGASLSLESKGGKAILERLK